MGIVTARHVYVRGHGPTGRYHGKYPKATWRLGRIKFGGCAKANMWSMFSSTTIRRVPRREMQAG